MTHAITALARLAARRPRTVLAAWAALVIALALTFGALGGAYSDELEIPGSDSEAAAALLADASEGAGSSMIVAAPDSLAAPEAAARVDALVEDVSAAAGSALDDPLVNPLDQPERAAATGALSPDGTAVSVSMPIDTDALTDAQLEDLEDVAADASADGWEVAYAGELARAMDLDHSRASELVGIAVAIVALGLGLGAVAAAATPLVAGIVAVTAGIASLGLLSHATTIPEIAPTLATMIGLGVGIDYALFQVVRMRRLLDRGVPVDDAVVATAASAGTAAAFAGITVALSICALALSGVSFIGWLGYASAIVVIVVVITALTFTPALLAVLGPRLTTRRSRGAREGAGIARVARAVVRRPWASTLGALAVLAVLAAPALTFTLGMTGPGDRPEDTQSRASYDLRAERFGEGANATLSVAVALDPPATGADDPRLVEVSQAITATGAASATPLVPLDADPAVASSRVTPAGDANADSTAQLVEDLRAIDVDGAEVHVGGATASRIDLEERVAARLPWVVAAVVAGAALVLTVAFRSVLIPLKAAALNLVSVAAAYGVVVAVFQWGWGASLLGLDGPVPIDAFVPMILFTVLFGLSTDYEVFLVTAMREHGDRTGDARGAIVEGMRTSGRVVTIAAVIMVAVFASFVLDADPTIKVFGVGLAASIIIDATVIRMLLVPTLMALLGRRAWWVPRWLGRILPAPHGAGTQDHEMAGEPSSALVGTAP
ncbi:MMPL family transporter [Demequina silvatica]|uniref:MMPL family transporter n=1 Tax=Demequina silvatica TaxID=1638988 RepID=UPI0007862869|nr:MMPL family transporter [Demequina silvatica]